MADTIARVETFQVGPRWLFVRVETTDGVVGWGEATCEGRSETAETAVHQIAELIIGRDPLRIEDHHQVMTNGSFYRGGAILASAVSGIDQALWDIAGKTLGAPVHVLLGGPVRDRVQIYAWVGGDEPAEVAEHTARHREAGLRAVKLNGGGLTARMSSPAQMRHNHDTIAAAVGAIGPDGLVGVDFHGRYTLANARRMASMLSDLPLMFIEEPVVPENSHVMGRVVEATTIPIATGERLFNRQEFLPVLQQGVTIAQPDLSHAGGITECRKIATMAEAFGAFVAPHCPLGPIALAACLQVDLASSNALIQEQSLGIHYNVGSDLLDYLVDRSVFEFHDGCIERLTGPGLGIEVDEAAVRSAAQTPHHWRGPLWRHADGGFAEW